MGCTYAYLPMNRPLFFPPIDEILNRTVALFKQFLHYVLHLPRPVVLLDYWLMLVRDQRHTLKEGRKGRYKV